MATVDHNKGFIIPIFCISYADFEVDEDLPGSRYSNKHLFVCVYLDDYINCPSWPSWPSPWRDGGQPCWGSPCPSSWPVVYPLQVPALVQPCVGEAFTTRHPACPTLKWVVSGLVQSLHGVCPPNPTCSLEINFVGWKSNIQQWNCFESHQYLF